MREMDKRLVEDICKSQKGKPTATDKKIKGLINFLDKKILEAEEFSKSKPSKQGAKPFSKNAKKTGNVSLFLHFIKPPKAR